MIIHKNRVLRSTSKKPILYDIYYIESEHALPVVIYSHGYKGFKDWGAWPLVAKRFADAGFCFIKFNFSHNGGTEENPTDFPDLDAFAENNFSLELDDLNRVLNHIESEEHTLPALTKEISVIGHSRGGGIVLIKAAEDARIKKVVCLASISNFESRFYEGTPEFEHWKKEGVIHIENARTKQQLPHNFQFYEDFDANRDRFSIQKAVKNLSKPLLIVHGDADPTVAIDEAKALDSWAANSILVLIPGADHVFGASHPWEEDHLPKDLEKVVDKTIDFLK